MNCESASFNGVDLDGLRRTYQCNKTATTIVIWPETELGEEGRMVVCPEHMDEIDAEATPTEEYKMFVFAEYLAPHSEVMMHLGLAGKIVCAYSLGGGRSVQIVESTPDDFGGRQWRDVSFPVGMNESGFFTALQRRVREACKIK